MAGTAIGGKRAAAANRLKHGDDFYSRIGAKGGALGKTGGFYNASERARIAGAKGGAKSVRTPAVPHEVYAKFWNDSDNVQDVARHFGITDRAASDRACRMRKMGYTMQVRVGGRRKR